MKLLLNNPAIINLVNEKVKKYKLIKQLQWKLIQDKVAVYRFYDIPNMRMHYNLCLWELKNQPRISKMMNKFKQKTDKVEKKKSEIDFIDLAEELYESAYTAYDIYTIVKHDNNYSYEDEMIYYICKNNIKNETLLLAFYLFFLFRNNKKIEMSEFIKYG